MAETTHPCHHVNSTAQGKLGLEHASDHQLNICATRDGSNIHRLDDTRLHQFDIDIVSTPGPDHIDCIRTCED